MPIYMRLPKRGFKNISRKEYVVVNIEDLNKFADETVVTPELLRESGIIKKVHPGVKILGRGELERKLEVRANGFSKSAVEKITAAGGKAEVI